MKRTVSIQDSNGDSNTMDCHFLKDGEVIEGGVFRFFNYFKYSDRLCRFMFEWVHYGVTPKEENGFIQIS